MKTLFHLFMIAALGLVASSCESMRGGAPADELQQQLTIKVESVDVVNNTATVNGSTTASEPSAFTEYNIGSPSLVLKEHVEGEIEPLLPVQLVSPRYNESSYKRRVSLATGESKPFSITLQVTTALPNRNPVPGMLYLTSDNGISGHLISRNSAVVMKVVHLLSDNKGQSFDLRAAKELLVIVVDGRLGVKLMK